MKTSKKLMETFFEWMDENIDEIVELYDLVCTHEVDADWVLYYFDDGELRELRDKMPPLPEPRGSSGKSKKEVSEPVGSDKEEELG